MTILEAILLRAGHTPRQLGLADEDVEWNGRARLSLSGTVDRQAGRTKTVEHRRIHAREHYRRSHPEARRFEQRILPPLLAPRRTGKD